MMMVRIFTLSLAILLPRILLIPVFFILYGLAGLALGVAAFLLAPVSPFIAILFVVVFGLSLATIPMMIGIRLGFTARGH